VDGRLRTSRAPAKPFPILSSGVSRVFMLVYCCGAKAPIPSHKAHGRLRGLSKQRFQRAFMPQCGRLRSMRVCGFEPTDPSPRKIEEEMKGAPYRPRLEDLILRSARPAARLGMVSAAKARRGSSHLAPKGSPRLNTGRGRLAQLVRASRLHREFGASKINDLRLKFETG